MQLAEVETVVNLFGTVVTSLAVVAAGLWAYFHFRKRRTYRPRLEVSLSGDWRHLDHRPVLHVTVTVKNIGASITRLRQAGTGLRVSTPVTGRDPTPAAIEWRKIRVFDVLKEQQWIEPGESIGDDLLLDLGDVATAVVLLEIRMVWTWSKGPGSVVVFARRAVFADGPGPAESTEATSPGQPAGVPFPRPAQLDHPPHAESWLVESPWPYGQGSGAPAGTGQPDGSVPGPWPGRRPPPLGGIPHLPRQSAEDPATTAEWERDKGSSD